MDYTDVRKAIVQLSKLPYQRGFTDTTGLIITVRVGENRFLNTGSGISFRRFIDSEDDLVLFDGEFNKISGHRPVPASTQISVAILKAFPNANAVMHVHSHTTGAFAALGISPKPITPAAIRLGPVPIIYDESEEEFIKNGGDLKLIPLKTENKSMFAGNAELIERRHRFSSTVVRTMKQYEKGLEQHSLGFLVDFDYGLFTIGRHLDETFDAVERIENNAKLLLNMKILGGDK
ncbi:class II aldolase/adducin family protein [Brevibacillus sp. SAFN-007a]|uniref:class II aldolase/adducin family protein n=1 Tax=Brevibacillus sp. SAFN-007a TaxID=3436862 RepID=UPI003F7FE085